MLARLRDPLQAVGERLAQLGTAIGEAMVAGVDQHQLLRLFRDRPELLVLRRRDVFVFLRLDHVERQGGHARQKVGDGERRLVGVLLHRRRPEIGPPPRQLGGRREPQRDDPVDPRVVLRLGRGQHRQRGPFRYARQDHRPDQELLLPQPIGKELIVGGDVPGLEVILARGERGEILPGVDADDEEPLGRQLVGHRDRQSDPADVAAPHENRAARRRLRPVDGQRNRLAADGEVQPLGGRGVGRDPDQHPGQRQHHPQDPHPKTVAPSYRLAPLLVTESPSCPCRLRKT